MRLKILGIRGAGDLKEERVVFEVEGDGNVGRSVVMTSRVTGENTVSSRVSAPYWFIDKDVKNGDLVVLYTKEGSYNCVENKDKSHSHFFYQGIKESLYQTPESCVVLMESTPWFYSSRRLA